MNKLEEKIQELKDRLIEIHESDMVFQKSLDVMKDLEKDIVELSLIVDELKKETATSGGCPRCGEKLTIKGYFLL